MSKKKLVPVCLIAIAMCACSDSSSGKKKDADGGTFGTDDPDGGSGEGSLEWNGCVTTVKYTGDEYRTYSFETNCPLLNDFPSSGELEVVEEEGRVVARTPDVMFDALFALAMQEVEDAGVESISDGAFNNGEPVECSCFETGAEWHYVWTRDTAYAAHLGLAVVEPERTARSLLFKISDRKQSAGGGQKEIVQDTGSGGSWPVSTDRVVWALGAWEVLKFLEGEERQEFFDAAYEAVVNTVERDREAVFDSRDGLYRGEQSFLDWREQTYPTWTADTTVHQGMSKALSTNAGHHAILEIASSLAEEAGDSAAASKYSSWASDLAQAINSELWLAEHGMYSTLKTTELDDSPLEKFDLLGESLAVLGGIADEQRAKTIVASYPHTVAGPPVIWPQNPMTPIYHNRGIWPFVTAYGVRAGAKAKNDQVVERGIKSLMIGAATNLSNMENFEFMTLSNHVDDGAMSGPVINSRRQLWSVAGYLSMVIHTLFGVHADQQGISFSPFIPSSFHQELFSQGDEITLRGLPYKGKRIDVVVDISDLGEESGGYFGAGTVSVNGSPIADGYALASEISDGDIVRIEPGAHQDGNAEAKVVEDQGDFTVFYAPKEPLLSAVSLQGNALVLSWDPNGETDVVFNIYRNGSVVASDVTGTTWTDPTWTPSTSWTPCYSVEAEYAGSGATSHHAMPQCWWGASYERIFQYEANEMSGPATVYEHGRTHFSDWGYPTDELYLESFSPTIGGTYYVQLDFGNGRPVDTGITCGVKRVEVFDESDDSLVGGGIAVMPHLGFDDWGRWDYSSFVSAKLQGGETYRVVVSDESNMTYFDHFALYTGGDGGSAGVLNRVNISGIKLLLMEAN